jgi:hypothetical protein
MIKRFMTKRFIKDRNAAFLASNLDWAKKMLPLASSDRVVEMAFHKARLEWTGCPPELREASKKRLWELGSAPLGGDPYDFAMRGAEKWGNPQ